VEDLSDTAYIDLYGDETADDDLNSHNNESKNTFVQQQTTNNTVFSRPY